MILKHVTSYLLFDVSLFYAIFWDKQPTFIHISASSTLAYRHTCARSLKFMFDAHTEVFVHIYTRTYNAYSKERELQPSGENGTNSNKHNVKKK